MRKLSILILAAALVVAASGMVMALEKSGNVNVTIKVAEFIEVDVPDNLYLSLDKLDEGDSATGSFAVSANTNFTVTVNSAGFGEDNPLNDLVTYSLTDHNISLEVGGEASQTNIPAGTHNGSFEVIVEALDTVDDWTNISADEYTDIITWTVSAE